MQISHVRRRAQGLLIGASLALSVAATATAAATVSLARAAAASAPPSACHLDPLNHRVQHVVNLVFDNTHFRRDNPNVPSDLEQMPHLLDVLTGRGTLITHEHTPLIAHTATDILTSLTGRYGDTMGMPVSNGFGFYDTSQYASFRSSFNYWTARLGGTNDNTYYMLAPNGKNAPAPWVPFTRAGCDVGGVATANLEVENPTYDLPVIFGANAPETKEGAARQVSNFEGIAIHCARDSRLCQNGAQAKRPAVPDVLPDEPGGYTGYRALFGHRYVAQRVGPISTLSGAPITGFPGFDAMTPDVSLGYVAAMQEHGVPVTYAYISDAHANHTTGMAYGPGEAGYVAQLHAYDQAFARFFARLAADGITTDNTVFSVTSDEGDHFVGGPPAPAGCNGATISGDTVTPAIPCTYSRIGELDANLSGLLGAVPPYSAGAAVPAMSVHSDSAPTVYLNGRPGQTAPVTRTAEQAAGLITAPNPITGDPTTPVTKDLAGEAGMRAVHMVTADPRRTPTFTLFGNPDYYLCATGYQCPEVGRQVKEDPTYAWSHGTIAPDINTTWLGLAGPGVLHRGIDRTTWSDHADDRPTLMALTGLRDDYRHDGRVLVETLDEAATPAADRAAGYRQLAVLYKQLDACVGQFGLIALQASTRGLEGNNDAFRRITAGLTELTAERNALADRMSAILDRGVSPAPPSDGSQTTLEHQGQALLAQMHMLAGS